MTHTLVLAALALCAISPLGAQSSELLLGAKVRVRTNGVEAPALKGTVLGTLGDSLAISDDEGRVVRLSVADISSIERSLGRSRSAGARRGALWGAGVMLPLALAGVSASECTDGASAGDLCGDSFALGVGAGLLTVGAGVGALVGTAIGVEQWEVLHRPAHIAIAPTRGGVRAGIQLQF